jgi:hypothetical protein
MSQIRPLMKQQHEVIALNHLHCGGTSSNRVEGILQEFIREGTTSGHWTWHSGFLSLPGLLGIHLLIAKVWPNHDVICETDHLARDELQKTFHAKTPRRRKGRKESPDWMRK